MAMDPMVRLAWGACAVPGARARDSVQLHRGCRTRAMRATKEPSLQKSTSKIVFGAVAVAVVVVLALSPALVSWKPTGEEGAVGAAVSEVTRDAAPAVAAAGRASGAVDPSAPGARLAA